MHTPKVLLVLGVFIVAVTSLGFAAGSDEQAAGESGDVLVEPYTNTLPIVKAEDRDKVKYKIYVPVQGVTFKPVSNDLPVYKYYAELTNVVPEWYNLEEYGSVIKAKIAGGDIPDIVNIGGLGTGPSGMDLSQWSDDGILIPLNDLIDKYAPNLNNWWQTHKLQRFQHTAADKETYFVSYYELPSYNQTKLSVNQQWLDALGLAVPSTVDEFYEVLKAFRDEDPNNNGKNDEIPLVTFGNFIGVIIDAFGVQMGRGMEGWQMPAAAGGKITFAYTDPRYREALAYLNKLYSENLLDREYASAGYTETFEKAKLDIMGSVIIWINTTFVLNSMSPLSDSQATIPVYKAIPPLKGPRGDQRYIRSRTILSGGLAITNRAEHPEVAMRYIDFLRSSEEAIEAQNYGVEGITYNKVGGRYELIDSPENPFSRTLEEIGGRQPPYGQTVTKVGYDLRWPKWMPPMVEALEQYYIDTFPHVAAQLDEIEIQNRLYPDIQTYAKEMLEKFITGQESLDTFDEYVATLNGMGVDELLKVKQAQYDRYTEWMKSN